MFNQFIMQSAAKNIVKHTQCYFIQYVVIYCNYNIFEMTKICKLEHC